MDEMGESKVDVKMLTLSDLGLILGRAITGVQAFV